MLKAPAHLAELDHLVNAFPGAVIVHLHRDIVETIASAASLFAVFRSTYSDEVDPFDVGTFQTEQTELRLRRAVEYRSRARPRRQRSSTSVIARWSQIRLPQRRKSTAPPAWILPPTSAC